MGYGGGNRGGKGNYDNNLTGVLFRNDKKDPKDSRDEKKPDYTGQAEVNGVQFWLSAWLKDGKSGKFMKLAFQAKDDDKGSDSKGDSRGSEDRGRDNSRDSDRGSDRGGNYGRDDIPF